MKRLMITKNSVLTSQNPVVNHESGLVKPNPEVFRKLYLTELSGTLYWMRSSVLQKVTKKLHSQIHITQQTIMIYSIR